MSAIFGFFSNKKIDKLQINSVIESAYLRGANTSSLLLSDDGFNYSLYKFNKSILETRKNIDSCHNIIVGFSGLNASQSSEISPIIKEDLILFHDGIVNDIKLDFQDLSECTKTNSYHILDSILDLFKNNNDLNESINTVINSLKGTLNCILLCPKLGKVFSFSNHGSLFFIKNDDGGVIFSSDKYSLTPFSSVVEQIKGVKEFDLLEKTNDYNLIYNDFFPKKNIISKSYILKDNPLIYKKHSLKRCNKCILPETMPFIKFDAYGVCNYCLSYKSKNNLKNKNDLMNLIEPYRKNSGYDCIVPFSGGRDSCYSLDIIVNELGLKPITYTYDWGMVTDVGRRNISLICGKYGVENIVIAADIRKKRLNVARNFNAWLKNPHLGMLNILSAGDKHFFRYVNIIKEKTGIDLNLWGVNPLEVTHFKTGFLGIEPDFERQKVYASGKMGQLRYHSKRLKEMVKSPGYFNGSLWDTYSGEYFRSFSKKKDYFHMFDYWQWSEDDVDKFLDNSGWERASDTASTWRIGDGTAGIYNYIYYTLAGFTEHDTFRSNQIREGQITRDKALELIEVENQPCQDNLRWYLSSIDFDFNDTINFINSIERKHDLLY